MNDYFVAFAGKTIPVLGWNFLADEKEAAKLYNSATWRGWQPEWKAIATNGLGDAIVVHEDRIYEVAHGTGSPAELGSPLATDLSALADLLKELQDFVECTDDDSLADLRKKRDHLQRLKKLAPKPLKSLFDDALADAKDCIEDARFKQTPAGRLQASVEANHRAWEAAVLAKWAVEDLKIRRCAETELGVMGFARAEDIPAIAEFVRNLLCQPVKNLLRTRAPG